MPVPLQAAPLEGTRRLRKTPSRSPCQLFPPPSLLCLWHLFLFLQPLPSLKPADYVLSPHGLPQRPEEEASQRQYLRVQVNKRWGREEDNGESHSTEVPPSAVDHDPVFRPGTRILF